jgi:RNA polymerase sigma-70 factor, ECF subfamily
MQISQDIIVGALNGKSGMLDELVRQVRPTVERQLLRYPVSEADRQDLLQTTLLQIVRRLSSFRGDSSFSTWLFRVTANEALMLLRSQRRLRAKMTDSNSDDVLMDVPDSPDKPSADQAIELQQRQSLVRDALSDLPEDYRDVVVAHYHLDLGLNDIAERFDITESAVRSRLHRARTRLRTMLEEPKYGAFH